MSSGELMFACGVGLFVLTILLAVLFLIKKPKYEPKTEYAEQNFHKTQRLQNGYPTDSLTIRRESASKMNPMGKRTEKTLPLSETEKLPSEETELLPQPPADAGETVLLEEKTEALVINSTSKLE